MSSGNWIILAGMIIVGLIFLLASQGVISSWMSLTEEDIQKADAEELVSLIYRTAADSSQKFYYCIDSKPTNITIKEGILNFERYKFRFSYTIPKEVSEVELVETTKICILKEGNNITLVGNIALQFCPGERLCSGAPGSEKDYLGKDCCPENSPVCASNHCCPTDKPKWCDKPVDENPRCMSEQDLSDSSKCKKPEYKFKILFIQLNSKISDFKQKAEAGKDVWVSLTPLSKCPDSVGAIVEENKICNVPDQAPYCNGDDSVADATLNAIRSCAQSWGYNDYTRVEGVLPGDWVCTTSKQGVAGYTNIYSDVLVSSEGDIKGTSSHEMGHTFGLCDEGYGGAPCQDCDNGNGICSYGGIDCHPAISASSCISIGGYNCPDRPESNSIMCSDNICSTACSPGNVFAPTSYAHLEQELSKYC